MLTYIVKIGYEQLIFDNGEEALSFAQSVKTHITDHNVTVKIIIALENDEDPEA